MSKGKILFQLSGSIACFKACQLISQLVKAGYELEVVATKSALHFVGEATLEGLTGRRVHSELFAAGEYMKHIHLIRWADLVLLCPASANTLAKMAAGIGDDLVTTLFLAHDFAKPYFVAPAMNKMMMRHPATQAALEKLAAWGVDVLGSGEGTLACGEIGEGRLLEPDEIFALLEARLRGPKAKLSKVIVTSGGTREPIDGVRSIVNTSTGRTGSAIASELSRLGHDVTLVRARSSVPGEAVREVIYETFDDLRSRLVEELSTGAYQAVIHAAAVSDYAVDEISIEGQPVRNAAKIDSAGGLTLKLKKNPKLVTHLREFAKNDALKVVAFKLTNTSAPSERLDATRKLAEQARPDLIVQNDLSDITADSHLALLFTARDGVPRDFESSATKLSLAHAISRFIEEGVPS